MVLRTAPTVSLVKLEVPTEHVLLLTLNRPQSLNAVSPDLAEDVKRALAWFDSEPELWVVIVTGAGRAFCAGADLKAWRSAKDSGSRDDSEEVATSFHGFANISRRSVTSKPLIAAVNGGAYGGGVEIILNCDLVIASDRAEFALPEVKRGVTAAQGGIPRIAAIAGHQLASEMLLTGRTISAQEAHSRFGFVNTVVPHDELIPTAIAWARRITQNSPDAVASTKRALIIAQEVGNFEQATIAGAYSQESKQAYTGGNIKEGLRAFSEKRKPVWKNPAKL
ncbi:enoyl-CoA hydratase/carnithine racemase [Gautieria morchelliformis]|nr:enoyl-CoA hydratase/carnithine racemase [Gautieria morchelliformis]